MIVAAWVHQIAQPPATQITAAPCGFVISRLIALMIFVFPPKSLQHLATKRSGAGSALNLAPIEEFAASSRPFFSLNRLRIRDSGDDVVRGE